MQNCLKINTVVMVTNKHKISDQRNINNYANLRYLLSYRPVKIHLNGDSLFAIGRLFFGNFITRVFKSRFQVKISRRFYR